MNSNNAEALKLIGRAKKEQTTLRETLNATKTTYEELLR